jgi:hypothetical protein
VLQANFAYVPPLICIDLYPALCGVFFPIGIKLILTNYEKRIPMKKYVKKLLLYAGITVCVVLAITLLSNLIAISFITFALIATVCGIAHLYFRTKD